MPHPEIEALSKDSKKGQISAAVSACVQREMANGRTQDEALGMCYGMARETGAPVPAPKGGK